MTESKKVKINLVSGGCGYIGSNTVLSLLERGERVLIVDNLSNSHLDFYNSAKNKFGDLLDLLVCDVRHTEKILSYVGDMDVDSIIHFAALKSVPESMEIPLEYIDVNIGGLISILKICKKKNPGSFIFSSSCSVYGGSDDQPVNEMTPLMDAESVYGYTKRAGEDIIRNFASDRSIGTKFYILRYFNPIGNDNLLIAGESPKNKLGNILPALFDAYESGKDFIIFGDTYDTPDGTCIRDYIHVSDLAEAHVICKYQTRPNANPSIYNIGTGLGTSVMQLVDQFSKVVGEKIRYTVLPPRAGDIPFIWADNSKALRELGWEPKHSIMDAIKSAYLFRNKSV